MASIGRNDPCPCGSGKRAKQCCYRLGAQSEIETSPSDTYFTSAEQLWLWRQGRTEDALASMQRGLALRPDFGGGHANLGLMLHALGRRGDAIRCMKSAAALEPNLAWVHANLGNMLYGERDFAGAAESFRHAVAHSVGYAIESLLAQLDTARIELVAFPTQSQEDELTWRIRPRFASWPSIAELRDEAAAAMIHAAAIDVLVDLSGHTANNRLPVLAWKPAPVQVSWLGYFGTTGVPGVDYLLADHASVPQSERAQFTETLHYLPATRLCFTPPRDDDAIAPSSAPAEANGYVTFGSFQSALKLNDAVFAAWAEVLRALPTARLRLQNGQMHFPASRAHLQERRARAGIDAGRVALFGTASRADYLRAHRDVDMILDTFPYPGATTTCEALWMGVPTMTIEGDSLASRQGLSLLACVGLDDWIARDRADYFARALAHARDIAALSALRLSLRARALRSPLFDAVTFARNLEDALVAMWRQWAAKGGNRAAENA